MDQTDSKTDASTNTDSVADTSAASDPHLSESSDLAQALAKHSIALPAEQVELLDRYRAQLWDWNTRINLTRHTTFDKFVARDVVDSLQLAELLTRGARVLDIGSGGGVPGLILAIVRPDLKVSVCDSVTKKARVLSAIVEELGLSVKVYPVRVQDILELATFDTLAARGVASLAKLLGWLAPHWDAFDELLLIKGRRWPEERGEARHLGVLRGKNLRRAAHYTIPGAGESVILRIVQGVQVDD